MTEKNASEIFEKLGFQTVNDKTWTYTEELSDDKQSAAFRMIVTQKNSSSYFAEIVYGKTAEYVIDNNHALKANFETEDLSEIVALWYGTKNSMHFNLIGFQGPLVSMYEPFEADGISISDAFLEDAYWDLNIDENDTFLHPRETYPEFDKWKEGLIDGLVDKVYEYNNPAPKM